MGPVIIVSGPSGVGKSTLLARLILESGLPLRHSISATTRAMRSGEQDGVHYFFLTDAQFEEKIQAGAFLEWAQVHRHRYGTLWTEVEEARRRGIGVILDIDVQGAAKVRAQCPGSITIFLRTSTWDLFEARLRNRGTESEQDIALRLANARLEMERAAANMTT